MAQVSINIGGLPFLAHRSTSLALPHLDPAALGNGNGSVPGVLAACLATFHNEGGTSTNLPRLNALLIDSTGDNAAAAGAAIGPTSASTVTAGARATADPSRWATSSARESAHS